MNWTAEAEALLIRLWGEGKSMGVIAEEMQEAGYPVPSRSAVSGRINVLRARGVEVVRRETPQAFRSKLNGHPVTHDNGVEYFENLSGCKAILDKRGGAYNLPMCCGRKRHGETPYCPRHLGDYQSGGRK